MAVSQELKRFDLISSELDSVYHEASLRLGISDSALCILYTICCFGDRFPLAKIIRLSGLSKQTVNSALRKLEQDELIYLASAGGKSKLVCLTEKGQALSRHTAVRLLQAEDEIFSSWSPEDVDRLIELTQRFLTDLRSKVREL